MRTEKRETNKIFQLSQLYASKKKMLKISQRGREESPFPFSTALLTRPYFCLFLCPDTRNMITLTTDGFYDLVGTPWHRGVTDSWLIKQWGPSLGRWISSKTNKDPPSPRSTHNLAWDTFLLFLLSLPATRETITETCRPLLGSLNE